MVRHKEGVTDENVECGVPQGSPLVFMVYVSILLEDVFLNRRCGYVAILLRCSEI